MQINDETPLIVRDDHPSAKEREHTWLEFQARYPLPQTSLEIIKDQLEQTGQSNYYGLRVKVHNHEK